MKPSMLLLIVGLVLLCTSTLYAQPSIVPDGPLEFCELGSVTLCVEPDYLAYFWNTGQNAKCISVAQSGSYYAVLISANDIDSSLVENPTIVTVNNPEPHINKIDDTLFVQESYTTYQWYVDDEIIVDANEQYYVVPNHESVWIYHVEVVDDIGCSGVSWWVDFPSAIDELNKISNVTLFPNPCSDVVNISTSEQILTVLLTDVSGKTVLERRNRTYTSNTTIDVSMIPQGIYFLQIELVNGRQTKKLVINH